MPNNTAITDEEIIAAGEALLAERGRQPTANTIRQKTGRGHYGRINTVWQAHRAAATAAATPIRLPPDVEVALTDERSRSSVALELFVHRLWQIADGVISDRLKAETAALNAAIAARDEDIEAAVDNLQRETAARESAEMQVDVARAEAEAEFDRLRAAAMDAERRAASSEGRIEQMLETMAVLEVRLTAAEEAAMLSLIDKTVAEERVRVAEGRLTRKPRTPPARRS